MEIATLHFFCENCLIIGQSNNGRIPTKCQCGEIHAISGEAYRELYRNLFRPIAQYHNAVVAQRKSTTP